MSVTQHPSSASGAAAGTVPGATGAGTADAVTASLNVCSRILEHGRRHPDRLALRVPRLADGFASHDDLSYGELLSRAAARQQALRAQGLGAGDRVLVLARPGLELYVLMVALLASGIVPVLVDRGMSRARLVAALRACGARVVIGERAVLRLWWFFPVLWRWRRYALDGRAPGVRALGGNQGPAGAEPDCLALPPDAHGLITFTSGSTGAPKGADRTHGSLVAQHLAIRAHWPDRADDVDMPCFPVLVLHNLCCGLTTVIPAVDLATPGRPDAERVLQQLERDGVTRLAAAPAFMMRIVQAALAGQRRFPGVRSLVVGGATLPPGLAERCLAVFPQAHCRIVYGSTEAEPIAEIDMADAVAQDRPGRGHLLGHPAAVAEVCVVDPARPLANDEDVRRARVGVDQVGEILVAGAHVLQRYVDNPAANAETKIPRADGGVWHRTGDAGRLDAQGRLWLEGRVKDAVMVGGLPRHTLALEKALDRLPGIARSALVADAEGRPALVVAGPRIAREALASVRERMGFPALPLYRIDEMPVDGRHNSKIDRPALRDALARGALAAMGEA